MKDRAQERERREDEIESSTKAVNKEADEVLKFRHVF